MPGESFTERLFKRFGYAPIRDVSQTHPDLAESLQWEQKPAKIPDYLETYEKAIWTYAAVYRIATSAAKVPFRIYRKRVTKKGQRTELTDHLINYVLATPNPYATRFDLWEATFAFAELCGDSYWELVSEGNKPPEEIYVLRPDRMEVKPAKKKLVDSYEFEINGRKIRFLPEDILHFKYFSATSDLYGTSANAAAEKSIILDLYALQFNARFFKAGARLMGTLETDRHLSDKAFKRLERKWVGRYGGMEKSFKTAILEEGLKYKPIASTHTDMEFIEQRKMTREEILAAYGVHPAIVGLFEYCIAKGEKVLLANGEEVEIEKLRPGQEVLNFNVEKERFEKHEIKEVMPRGRRQVSELRTGNRKIKATDNHPFLTLAPGINPAYPRKPVWKKLKDLKKGDLIAILTEVPDWMGTGNNHLPDGTVATKDLIEQLGLYMGDGNCTFQHGRYAANEEDKRIGERGGNLCFALPESDSNREYYIKQAKKVWTYRADYKTSQPMHVTRRKTCFYVNSAKAVKQIYDWGFKGTARTKGVPTWIFKLDKSLKRIFLKGYFHSDGGDLKFRRADGSLKTRIQIAASNQILVEQIRELCIQVGYSVCNINEQHRVTNYGKNDLWRFLICNFDGEKFVKFNSTGSVGKIGCKTGGKRNPLKILANGINWASIRNIKEIGKEETYDLEIENIHNFFVGSALVLNSNYANAEAQKKLFWEDTMVPKLKKAQENVSSFLLPRYGTRLIGEFDLSTVEALQESQEAKQKIACGLTDSGIMTRNEARHEYYQLDPVDGGDKITIRGKYITLAPEEGDGKGPELSASDLKDLVSTLRKRIEKR